RSVGPVSWPERPMAQTRPKTPAWMHPESTEASQKCWVNIVSSLQSPGVSGGGHYCPPPAGTRPLHQTGGDAVLQSVAQLRAVRREANSMPQISPVARL